MLVMRDYHSISPYADVESCREVNRDCEINKAHVNVNVNVKKQGCKNKRNLGG